LTKAQAPLAHDDEHREREKERVKRERNKKRRELGE
jgi:hypothetical protein